MRILVATVALAALPLALVPAAAQVAAPCAASCILPERDGTILDVSAEGRVTRVPDVATIRAGVVTQAPTAAAALAANAQRMSRVLAAVKRAGVAERDVRTASVGLSPQYRYADGQAPAITGYQATNTVAIRFHDVAASGAILDALVGEGANQIEGPSLTIDHPDAALDEARADAVKRARARADLYAKAAGMSVSRIISIAESGQNDGGSPPPMPYARMDKAAASTQLAAGETDVSVTISVRFLLR
jgi:uncharacterized protein YggE